MVAFSFSSSFFSLFKIFSRKAMGRKILQTCYLNERCASVYKCEKKRAALMCSFLHEHKIIIFGMMKKYKRDFHTCWLSFLLLFYFYRHELQFSLIVRRQFFLTLLDDDDWWLYWSVIILYTIFELVSEREQLKEKMYIIFHIHNHHHFVDHHHHPSSTS